MKATQPTVERWLPVVGYEGLYAVSDQGRVWSRPRIDRMGRPAGGSFLQPAKAVRGGYLVVNLANSGRNRLSPIHRLVTEAFLGPRPDGLQICHDNGDPTDNRVTNLRYGTPSENLFDRVRHGRHWQAVKTHCKWGHEFTPENTIYRGPGLRHRKCRACKNESYHRARASQETGLPVNP